MDVLNLAPTILAYTGDWGRSDGWGGGWWWLWRSLMLLVWIGVIALVVWWILRATQRSEPSGIERARAILAERYARGELNTEEYHERLERLR